MMVLLWVEMMVCFGMHILAMIPQVPGRLWPWCMQWPARLYLCV
jgi:hypothetical protein